MIGGTTDPTIAGLAEEVRLACRSRDELLEHTRARVERYVGPYYRDRAAGGEEPKRRRDPENHAFEFIALTQPLAVFNNPRVRVESARGTEGPVELAMVMRHALNRIIKDIKLKRTLKRLYPDYAMGPYCVALVEEVERKGYDLDVTTRRQLDLEPDAAIRWPQVRMVRPEHFVYDHGADGASEPKFQGHAYNAYVEDLIQRALDHKDEGWNIEELRRLQADATRVGWYGDQRNIPDRNEVVLWEIHVANYELEKGNPFGVDPSPGPDEGYHGTIFTLPAETLSSDTLTVAPGPTTWIRKPRPFYGPASGPYEIGCYLSVPGEWVGLSALTAVESEVRNLNAHVRALQRSAAKMKQIGIGTGPEEDSRKINQTQDGGAITLPNFDTKTFGIFNFGSLEQGRVAFIEMQRDRLNRISGLTEAQRGVVESGTTATANAIAAGASNTRLDGYIQGFHDFTAEVLRKIAWYVYYSTDVVFGLGQEAADEMSQAIGKPGAFKDPIYRGGSHDPDSGLTFEDLELDLEPYSMPHQSEQVQQQRTALKMQLVMQWVQFALGVPGAVDVRDGLKRIGDAFDDPGISDIVDPDKLEQAGIAALNPPPKESQGQPVTRRQAGAWPSAQREVGRSTGAQASVGAGVKAGAA